MYMYVLWSNQYIDAIEQLHVTSQVRRLTKMCGKNVWHLYRKRCIFNYSAAVEARTAKPLWHDNCLLVCTNILEE